VPGLQLQVVADRSLVTAHCAGLIVSGPLVRGQPQANADVVHDRCGNSAHFWEIPQILKTLQQQHGREEVLIAAADEQSGEVNLFLRWREQIL
jgi:hypothetical protein